MHKQPDLTNATREAFVTAFFHLAEQKRTDQITIRELASAAGYNRTTFYRYFEDIFALIRYAEDAFIADTLGALLRALGEEKIPNEIFFAVFLEKFKENRRRLSVFLSDENRTRFIRRMEDTLIRTMGTPIVDTPKNKVVMDLYFTGVFSALADHIQYPHVMADEDLLHILQRLFTNWYWPEVTQT